MLTAQDVVLAKLAIGQDLLRTEDVQESLRELEGLRAAGQRLSLLQLLVKKRVFSAESILAITRAIEATSFDCARCQTHHGFAALAGSAQLACPGCRGPLTIVREDGRAISDRLRTGRITAPAPARVPETKADSGSKAGTRADTATGKFGGARPTAEAPPELFGPYELLSELGRGGMGVVYKARHRTLGRIVALKVLIAGGSASSTQLIRFRREAELAAKLKHPGIVAVFDVGEIGGRHYFTMDYVEGRSLLDRIEKRDLPLRQAIEIARDLARALAHAHAAGVVHRDVKPANVIVDAQGKPALTDFGLAHGVDQDTNGRLTREGAAIGTPYYMSPEQARGELDKIGPGSDVYSLGVVLFEMLTFSKPFDAETHVELAKKIENEAPPRLGSIEPAIDADVEYVVAKALAKKIADRYPTAEAFALDLDAYLAGTKVAPRAGAEVARVAVGIARVARTVFAVVGVILVIVLLTRRTPAAPATPPLVAVAPRVPMPPVTAPPPVAPPAPPPGPSFPAELASVANTSLTRLTKVLGSLQPGHRESVGAVAFSPDEKRAFSSSADGTVRIWDLATQKEVASFPEPGTRLTLLAFSREGTRALARTDDRHLALYDLERATLVRTLEETTDSSQAFFSPDGQHALLPSRDQKLLFVDLEGDKSVVSLKARRMGALVFASDGARAVAISGEDAHLVLFDVASGEEIQKFAAKRGATAAAFFPDGEHLVAALTDGTLEVFEVASGRSTQSFGHPQGRGAVVACSPDGKRVLAGDSEGTLRLFDASNGVLVKTLPGHQGSIHSLAFSRNGTRALSGSYDRSVKLWDLEQGKELASMGGGPGEVRALALSPAGDRIVAATTNGTLTTWEIATGKTVATVTGHGIASTTERPVLSHDGKLALVYDGDHTLSIVDAATGAEVHTLGPRQQPTWGYAAAFSPASNLLVVSGATGRCATVFNVASGHATSSLAEPQPLQFVAFSPDGFRALAGSADGTAKLWNLRTGSVDRKIEGAARQLVTAAFTPDGTSVVVANRDGSLSFANLIGEAKVRKFEGHVASAHALAFAPDGQRLVTTGMDRTIRIWDVAAGKELDRIDLTAAGDRAGAVVFEADGRAFWVGTARGGVVRFELKTDQTK
jgi:WD40 repeat protein/serine/threonine protein kinase